MSSVQRVVRLAARPRPFTPAAQGTVAARRVAVGRVTCMAHPRRVAKVAKQIEREVGMLLISDKVLQQAVCPERRRGFDGAVSALASVTEVVISNDLQVARVYLSIYSDELGKAAAVAGLQRLEGYVRKHIGRQIRLRLTPEIRFVLDESIERTERVYKLLDQVAKIDSGLAEPPPIAIPDGRWEEQEEEDDEDGAVEGAVDLGFFDDEAVEQQPRKGKGQQQEAAGGRPGGRGRRRAPAAAAAAQEGPEKEEQGEDEANWVQRDSKVIGEDDFEDMLREFKMQQQKQAAARRSRR